MKIDYLHIKEHIKSKPKIEEISAKLLQLGHEHEIDGTIFDIEFTPNRGDCLSILGILRDLRVFYDVNLEFQKYEKDINNFSFDFKNNATEYCPYITFLKIDIEENVLSYSDMLENYFRDLKLNKNNFFTDVSNFVSYEMGQPTHCYDAYSIDESIILESIDGNHPFETLLDKEIQLSNRNLVFLKGGEIINLAGVVGGKSTACSEKTKSVIVECAYFNPEEIIGQSLKYDIHSDAAYKFERGVDFKYQEEVLRRFIKIVEEHAVINNLEIYSETAKKIKPKSVPFNLDFINKIIGVKISSEQYIEYLSRLGFKIVDNRIDIPTHRNDVNTQNDIAEEIARSIGYDNLPVSEIKIIDKSSKHEVDIENKVKDFLVDKGFYEVINNPFVGNNETESIKVDNPLDSNREYLRSNLKNSMISNLLYNERRQKDSVKLFEISDIYSFSSSIKKKKVLAVIASGRVGKNYLEFSKKITNKYLSSIFGDMILGEELYFETISRDSIDSKLKSPVVYFEIEIDKIDTSIFDYKSFSSRPTEFNKYSPISEFPLSERDLSFSIKDPLQIKLLEEKILSYKNELLKETYIFDYYENHKVNEIKMGFRFIFQSNDKTITVKEVDIVIDDIIMVAKQFDSVSLPGL